MTGRRRAPEGYPHGPAAALVAHGAIAALDSPRAVILVEGVSDRIAVEAVAARMGEDLRAARIAVVATGGVHGLRRMLRDLGPRHPAARVSGLYDAGEREVVRRALESERMLRPGADPETLGFFACTEDLEDELIRACGAERVEARLQHNGDLPAFRRMQQQPQWRGRDVEAQLRRWIAGGAERKLRYARILVDALPLEDLPRPLIAALESAASQA